VRYSIIKWSEFILNGHSVEPNYLDLAGVGEYEVKAPQAGLAIARIHILNWLKKRIQMIIVYIIIM